MDKASRIGFEEEEEDEEQDRCCVYRSNKRGEGKGNYLGGKKKYLNLNKICYLGCCFSQVVGLLHVIFKYYEGFFPSIYQISVIFT